MMTRPLGSAQVGAAFDDLAHVPVGTRLDAALHHAQRGMRRRVVGAAADDDVDVGMLSQHLGERLGAASAPRFSTASSIVEGASRPTARTP